MSYFSELKVRHPDNKFIFYPAVLILLLGFIVEYYFGIAITFLVLIPISLIIILATILHSYRAIIEEIRFQDQRTQAMFNIYDLINPRLPLPFLSGWAAFPELISTILQHVKSSNPKYIVELGSGSSTIITSYLLEEIGKGKILSFDHDEKYGKITENRLEEHGLSEFAYVISSPLKTIKIDGNSYNWYDIDVNLLKDKIDILVVDGPPEKTQKHARYPALPYFYDNLSESAIIILDDAGRTEEKEIVAMWLKKYPEFTHEYIWTEKGISVLKRG
ncbi:MAG: class I SAM-dependent methyltransferase [Balneolaceae bacterium]